MFRYFYSKKLNTFFVMITVVFKLIYEAHICFDTAVISSQ